MEKYLNSCYHDLWKHGTRSDPRDFCPFVIITQSTLYRGKIQPQDEVASFEEMEYDEFSVTSKNERGTALWSPEKLISVVINLRSSHWLNLRIVSSRHINLFYIFLGKDIIKTINFHYKIDISLKTCKYTWEVFNIKLRNFTMIRLYKFRFVFFKQNRGQGRVFSRLNFSRIEIDSMSPTLYKFQTFAIKLIIDCSERG